MTKLLAIVGPTASGKSDLAMSLAQKFDGEIIAADSRTAYRYMDIGTAKPTAEDMLLIPHHLVDIADPNERISAAEFKALALAAIKDIAGRGKLALLVGGSGLYIDSVIFDFQFPPAGGAKLRRKLEALSDNQLQAKLAEVDPEAFETVDRANRRRVIRAIETAGLPRAKLGELRPDTLVIGLSLGKDLLQKRIEKRIGKMLEKGFIDEVKLVGERFGWDSEAFTAIGYRAFREAVLGTKTVEQATEDFAHGDMLLAKKQMTWFKRNPHIHWLDGSDTKIAERASSLVSEFLAA